MKIYLVLVSVLLVLSVTEGKKKKKSKPSAEKVNLFDTKNLNCLVCKAIVEELEAAINKVDPAKKVKVGTFRLNGDGTQSRKWILYAQSQEHLPEAVDKVFKGIKDYAQNKYKSSGEPTIISLMTHGANRNQVDTVPEED